MAKRRAPLLGQITFRLPSEFHQELLEVAQRLGIDLSALVNQMLREAYPTFLKRATKLAEEQKRAREEFDAIALPEVPTNHPLVLLAVEAGRRHPPGTQERGEAMVHAAGPNWVAGDPSLMLILKQALGLLQREDEQTQLEEAVRQWEAAAALGPHDVD